jgi:hypothetical protein
VIAVQVHPTALEMSLNDLERMYNSVVQGWVNLLAGTARRYPNLFAHWRFGLKPDGWAMEAV